MSDSISRPLALQELRCPLPLLEVVCAYTRNRRSEAGCEAFRLLARCALVWYWLKSTGSTRAGREDRPATKRGPHDHYCTGLQGQQRPQHQTSGAHRRLRGASKLPLLLLSSYVLSSLLGVLFPPFEVDSDWADSRGAPALAMRRGGRVYSKE
eukprot:scaffold72144_cov35-Tisochrysis_lutea.AAC.1